MPTYYEAQSVCHVRLIAADPDDLPLRGSWGSILFILSAHYLDNAD
jgi:hypothetical protein